jgi:hypothetical protein
MKFKTTTAVADILEAFPPEVRQAVSIDVTDKRVTDIHIGSVRIQYRDYGLQVSIPAPVEKKPFIVVKATLEDFGTTTKTFEVHDKYSADRYEESVKEKGATVERETRDMPVDDNGTAANCDVPF